MSVLASAAAVVILAADVGSDADTPTDAPSAWNHVWPWLLLGAGVFLFLLLFAVGLGWSRRRSPAETTSEAPEAPPAVAPPPQHHDATTRDIAVLTFQGVVGAERAYARVHDEVGPEPWLLEVAFVECHHRDRVVVRGTFAGRYLDVDHVDGRLLDEIRADVPEGSSALVVYAPTDAVEALLAAFGDSGARVTRHRVSAADAEAFEASVADAPPAAPPPAVL